uniref:DUF6174 domain-containing protein n=1 Tax=Armatimonas sp. TaxID=1872638 RepID=UPI00286B0D4D
CGGNTSLTTQEQQLSLARSNWTAKKLRSYKFTLRKNCFCTEEYTRPVTITVQNGVAINSPEHLKAYDTVEKTLDVIGEALTRKADQVDMDFSLDGWPRSVFIDHSRVIADEEYSLTVTDLVPL